MTHTITLQQRISPTKQSKSKPCDVNPVMVEPPENTPSSCKSLPSSGLKKLAKKSKFELSSRNGENMRSKNKREVDSNASEEVGGSDDLVPVAKRVKQVHFSSVCVEYPAGI